MCSVNGLFPKGFYVDSCSKWNGSKFMCAIVVMFNNSLDVKKVGDNFLRCLNMKTFQLSCFGVKNTFYIGILYVREKEISNVPPGTKTKTARKFLKKFHVS